jgi:beta-galactosidase
VNDVAHTPAFTENAKQQLRELIKQNYNHPSIFCWSLYNELALAKPDFEDERRLVTELNDLAHSLDPARLTAAATHKEKIDHPVNWITDLTAFNRYFGWYTGGTDQWGPGLDKLYAAFPDRCIGISEYGAGANVRQHEQRPTTKPRTGGAWHPEEWQATVHEAAWAAMKSRPWLWGTFVWNLADFAADQRNEGDQPGINDKGLVTYDRRTKKDAYFFYQANWTDRPMVHITGQRFSPRPAGLADIKIYSNCDTVELFINSRSLGVGQGSDVNVFTWLDVPLKEGANRVRAVGSIQGRRRCGDECMWQASPGSATRAGTHP